LSHFLSHTLVISIRLDWIEQSLTPHPTQYIGHFYANHMLPDPD